MMGGDWNTTLLAVIFSLPVVASLVCAVLVAVYSRQARKIPRRLTGTLVIALAVSTFVWGCMVLYLQWPGLFVVLQTVFYYAYILFLVLIYRIIRSLTGTGTRERFSTLHYIVPAIIPAALLVWSFFVPFEAQLHIVTSRGRAMAGYEAYTALFTSKAAVVLVWSVVYNLLSLGRIARYRRVIGDYSADEGRSPVRWLRLSILYMFLVTLIPLLAVGLGKVLFFGSLWMVIPTILAVAGLITFCYNIVSENYIVIADADESGRGRARRIDRERFEHYIDTQKPWLNPRLRISDVAADLHSNRTYVSNFINAEYGMNFSRYINLRRLRELDRLCLDAKNRDVSGIDLVFQAGFSTYQGYKRVKTDEDKMNVVKNF